MIGANIIFSKGKKVGTHIAQLISVGELIYKRTPEFIKEAIRFRDMLNSSSSSAEEKEKTPRGRKHLYVVQPEQALKRRIAVIDDDEAVTLYLNEFLTKKGYQVNTFQSPAAALKYVESRYGDNPSKESPFDLVLVDFKMPELDGLTLAKNVRMYFPAMPVVLITAYASIEGAVKAVQQGVYDYIEKPISVKRLDAILESVFGEVTV